MDSADLVPLNHNSGNRSVCSYFISSNEDATECDDNDSEDHWVIPKPPSVSYNEMNVHRWYDGGETQRKFLFF